MSDPALALQGALITALKASSGVANVGSRVYDRVPAPPPAGQPDNRFPYIRVGDDQVIGDFDQDACEARSEVFSRVHVWSRAVGKPEAKTIAGAVRDRILSATLTLTGFTIDVVEFEQAQHLDDPDGLTSHSIVEFRFLISHA